MKTKVKVLGIAFLFTIAFQYFARPYYIKGYERMDLDYSMAESIFYILLDFALFALFGANIAFIKGYKERNEKEDISAEIAVMIAVVGTFVFKFVVFHAGTLPEKDWEAMGIVGVVMFFTCYMFALCFVIFFFVIGGIVINKNTKKADVKKEEQKSHIKHSLMLALTDDFLFEIERLNEKIVWYNEKEIAFGMEIEHSVQKKIELLKQTLNYYSKLTIDSRKRHKGTIRNMFEAIMGEINEMETLYEQSIHREIEKRAKLFQL